MTLTCWVTERQGPGGQPGGCCSDAAVSEGSWGAARGPAGGPAPHVHVPFRLPEVLQGTHVVLTVLPAKLLFLENFARLFVSCAFYLPGLLGDPGHVSGFGPHNPRASPGAHVLFPPPRPPQAGSGKQRGGRGTFSR